MEDGNEKQTNKGEKGSRVCLTRVRVRQFLHQFLQTPSDCAERLCRNLQVSTWICYSHQYTNPVTSLDPHEADSKRSMLTIKPQHSHLIIIILFLFHSCDLKAANTEHKNEIPEIYVNKMDATYSTCVKVKSCVGGNISSFVVHIC